VIPFSDGVVLATSMSASSISSPFPRSASRHHPRRLGLDSKYTFLARCVGGAEWLLRSLDRLRMVTVLLCVGSLNINDI